MERTVKGAVYARRALQGVMALAVGWWMLYWLLKPFPPSKAWLVSIDKKMSSTFLGTQGSIFLMQALPIVVVVFLSYFVIELRRVEKKTARVKNVDRKPKLDFWTLPIFVRSPLGLLTLGDLLFLFAILFTIIWYLVKSAVHQARVIDHSPWPPFLPAKSLSKLGSVGVILGRTSLIPFALLWIPVSRGSPILRAIGVPFERAVRYHTWLGSLTVWLILGHGSILTAYFVRTHHAKEMIKWGTEEVSIVAGVVAFGAGALMLCTAISAVRRKFFDLFFTVHHLYLVYLLFFAFHVVQEMYYVIVPVLLFFLDRFMRMVQSRKSVDVLSAKVLPSGAIELKFAKPTSLSYTALSFVYVLLPSVSHLQWHPFSVASSPLDGSNQISIYIKPLGGFTKNLHDTLLSAKQSENAGRQIFKCPFSFKVGLEGPYGDDSMVYLKYKTLVLVAGGIGVTPFLAILRDLLHRYRLQQEELPTAVHLVFCVRHVSELHILDTLEPRFILPDYQDCLSIKVYAFVTSPEVASTRGEFTEDDTSFTRADTESFEDASYINVATPKVDQLGAVAKGVQFMSAISSNGQNIWVASTVVSTLVGFFISWGIFNVTVIKESTPSYVEVFLYLASIVVAVVLFGGGVMLLWAFNTMKRFGKSEAKVMSQLSMAPSPAHFDGKDIESVSGAMPESLWQGNVTLGKRPVWNEVFTELGASYEGQDVGVMVSGNHEMQQDIARECKYRSFSRASTSILHFHSISFEL